MNEAALICAIISAVAAIWSAVLAFLIHKRQLNNEYNKYILQDFLIPFSMLEADLMLLADNTKTSLSKAEVDKKFIEMLCKAKSYGKILKKNELVEFANFELSNPNAKIGYLINDFFQAREKFLLSNNLEDFNVDCKNLLERIRKIRDEIIDKLIK